ncbi:GM25595 [Drosophila sechellia]|uniref:GM25595 n=1 Tax=Drosophila sechellia TaxID=7238 RepID=B4HJ32_DROSE|nr:GM25595 [Drosophila sechellia]
MRMQSATRRDNDNDNHDDDNDVDGAGYDEDDGDGDADASDDDGDGYMNTADEYLSRHLDLSGNPHSMLCNNVAPQCVTDKLMPQNNEGIKMDRIVETNHPHQHQQLQHQPHPHDDLADKLTPGWILQEEWRRQLGDGRWVVDGRQDVRGCARMCEDVPG